MYPYLVDETCPRCHAQLEINWDGRVVVCSVETCEYVMADEEATLMLDQHTLTEEDFADDQGAEE